MFDKHPDFDKGILIDKPSHLSLLRRFTEKGIMLAAILMWISLLRPVVLLCLWVIGFRVAYSHLIKLGGARNPVFFTISISCVLVVLLTIILWNIYDRMRYSNRYKGRASRPTENGQLGALFSLPAEEVAAIKRSQMLEVYFLDKGQISIKITQDQKKLDASYNTMKTSSK